MSARVSFFLIAAAALLSATAEQAQSADFSIPNGDVAALKNAIITANTNEESDTINLAPGGIYTLTVVDNTIHGATGLPLIINDLPDPDLTIHGNAATLERSTSAPEFRILEIIGGAVVIIDGLTIANGKAIESPDPGLLSAAGGGIYNNHGVLTVTNCTIRNCTYTSSASQAFLGGAIFNDGANGGSANLTVSGTTFTSNTASLGGAISNWSANFGTATLTANNCTFTGNSAVGGGGIDNIGFNSRLVVTNSSFSGNAGGSGGCIRNARSAGGNATARLSNCMLDGNMAINGGGIYNETANGNPSLRVTNCTFSGNTAELGGGLYARGDSSGSGTVAVSNCTFSTNDAEFGGGILVIDALVAVQNSTLSANTATGEGGGIYHGVTDASVSAALTLLNCTLSGNSSPSAGALLNDGANGPSSVTLANTLFNIGSSGANIINLGSGVITSQGHNLSSDNAGGFLNASGDLPNTPAQLGSLASNGGPTRTHALLSGSAAINAGNNANAPPLDQRSYSRVGVSDIGAYEFGGTLPGPAPLLSVVSRKLHGATAFDINLPLTGSPGVECRSGGASGDYQLIFSFANTLASVGDASVTGGTGSVISHMLDADTHNYIVNLTGIGNVQVITVSLTNVNDSAGNSSSSVPISMGVLLGDANGNRSVNTSDIGQTKASSGQPVGASNFRTDVTVSGSINASDVGLVKSAVGTSLP